MTTTTEVPAAPTSPVDLAMNAMKPAGKTMPPVEAVLGKGEAVLEPKLDGWRLLIHRDEDGVHLYTRSANPQDGKLPHIEEELLAFEADDEGETTWQALPPGTWLDGEVAALKVNGSTIVNDWNAVQKALGCADPAKAAARAKAFGLSFVAFDLIAHGGIDARPLPFRARRRLLERVIENGRFTTITVAPQLEPTDENLAVLIAQGFEGGVVKTLDGAYGSDQRDKRWIKLKPNVTDDYVVMGFKPGENGFKGLIGAIEFGAYDEAGNLVPVARCSGMDFATRKWITAHQDECVGRVIEVAHEGNAVGDKPRFPQFRRWRVDKAPEECRLD